MAEAEAAGVAPPLVDLVLEDPRWEAAGLEAVATSAARAALLEVGRDPAQHELSLLACDDARIAGLNETFRGVAKPTNVLSWPAFEGAVPQPGGDGPVFLGDMALAFETCAREAQAAGIPLAAHAAHLVVHGLLHLLGHDHEDDTAAEAMEAIETKTLASLGIADPYSSQERP
ncbi:MAG: rRNA maturation RNase YbeY [Rhodobacteraceae bacterium]|nr:rRNA maturation RNase YbeY [Paracoccaceae bacterium]